MKLALCGMSGIGKSYWSSRLAKHGWRRFDCDALIAEKLAAEAGLDVATVFDLGRWMGWPHEPQYEARGAHYLALEAQVLREVLAQVRDVAPSENIVIDTTGSMIYLAAELRQDLRQTCQVVHLATTPAIRETMFQAYLREPRPLIWDGYFQPNTDETPNATLARCYPLLLQRREELYAANCAAKLAYESYRQPHLSVADFLRLLPEQSTDRHRWTQINPD